MHMRPWLMMLALALAACGGSSAASGSGDLGTTAREPDGGLLLTEPDGETCECGDMALPDFCLRCDDGHSECAHYVCAAGKCAVGACGQHD
jgi:hypothetical protein